MFGLFDWVWELLYSISKSMYSIIDKLLACANMLCGIEPIKYAGQEMDFLSFLMANPSITYAFVGSVLVGIFLVFVFGIIAIIRAIHSEKVEKTPAQIAVSIGKTLLIFLFIPVAMTGTIFLTNALMRILYSTTLGGSPDGLGRFLAGAFGQNGLKDGMPYDFYLDPDFNYMSTGNMKKYVDLADYDFFFSWIASAVILISVGVALLMFVDRAISIVILFIFSPLSLSTTVLDDGARFKLWRDQFLTKFLTGYGCIIAINIYALIVVAVTNDKLVFFDSSILNFMMKIVIIVGGGVSMQRIMALVGNLITAGGGSNELRDAAIARGSFARAMGMPFRATRSAINFVRDTKNTGLGTTVGRALGLKTSRDYQIENGRVNRGAQASGAGGGAANNKAGVASKDLGAGNKNAKNAILGGGNNNNKNGGGGGNGGAGAGGVAGVGGNVNNNPNQGNNMVNNAVNNALNNKGNDKK